jgi:thiamine kinase-like enzyme
MEYIPHSLPQNQWIRNMEQVETLFALHHCTWGKQKPAVEDPFRPGWTEDMTNTVLGCFARSMKAQVLLERLRKAQTLWQHMNFLCCITGDPNPTNWCVRDDGKLVLVDWERFGYGTPAVDLAILMPGLGSQDGSLERWLATEYVKCWLREEGFAPISVEVLQAQIRLAKLWSAVEFVTETSTQPESYQHRTRRYLVNNLQNLLQEIECIEKVLA